MYLQIDTSGWRHRIHECVLYFRIQEFTRLIPFCSSLNWLWRRCGPFTFKMCGGMFTVRHCVVLWTVANFTWNDELVWRVWLLVWYYISGYNLQGRYGIISSLFGEVVDFLYSSFVEVVVPNGIIIFGMYAYPVLPRNQGVYTSRQDHWPKWPHWKWCSIIIMLVFGDVSPMTTTTLSLFHMLCVKLSQEFTVKKDINDCCREVLQHHRSQRWFWMQTSTQNPQKRQQEIAGDPSQESEAKITISFSEVCPQLPTKKISFLNRTGSGLLVPPIGLAISCEALFVLNGTTWRGISGQSDWNVDDARSNPPMIHTGLVDWDFRGENKYSKNGVVVCIHTIIFNPLHKRF